MRYCKECGHHISFQPNEKHGYCQICDKQLSLKETIADHTLDARMSQLKAMHDLMTEANDENIYMRWISIGVPDCPSMDDIKCIALDDDSYNECFDLFVKLIAHSGNRY